MSIFSITRARALFGVLASALLLITIMTSDALANANTEYLDKNKTKPGVQVTASGLQYRVLKAGSGRQPSAGDAVEVHYKGSLINGKVFDSSYARGQSISFPLNRVIAGWTEGLQLMKVGAKYELVIPASLGYGKKGAGRSIPPSATLIFEVELLKVH